MTKRSSALDSTELTKLHAKAKRVCTLEISQKYITGFWLYEIIITMWNFSTLSAKCRNVFLGQDFAVSDGVSFRDGNFSSNSNSCTASDNKESQNVPQVRNKMGTCF